MEHTYQVSLTLYVKLRTSADDDDNETDTKIIDAFLEKAKDMTDAGELDNDLFTIKMIR